jgi:hypothetical protein
MRWLNWEAQQGESQLDTHHFASINKCLMKVCLHRGIIESFSYKGGPVASTVLLFLINILL